MKKLFFICLVAFLCGQNVGRADEGMWLPMFIDRLNYTDMQKMGLKLTPEEIYSVNHASLKDAIILFGRGCTGEIISSQGLILTNHHCGYGAIQSKSTVEKDYLTDGFWAMSMKEELPISDLSVKFLIRIEDVTKKVLSGLQANLTEKQRTAKVEELCAKIEKEATKDNGYDAVVKSFFEGNEYYLIVYQTYTDVRLVGAPPSSLGRYGADTDNWMWPRHKADFCLFRVYTAPDGSPAPYSDKNIPMTPKHSLPISIKGVKNGDFTMIMGYPGTTERYLTSYGIEMYANQSYPARIKAREMKLAIMREDMEASPEVRIKYSSKYASISNYWKNFIGTVKALNRLKVADKKRHLESQFEAWVMANDGRKGKYGTVLKTIKESYVELRKTNLVRIYFSEAIMGCEALVFSRRFSSLKSLLMEKPVNSNGLKAKTAELRTAAEKFYKDYNKPTDEKLTAAMLKMFYEEVPKNQQPVYFLKLAAKYKYDFNKLSAYLFSKSIFGDLSKVNNFLDNPNAKMLESDALLMLINAFVEQNNTVSELSTVYNEKLSEGKRLLVAGIHEMLPDHKFYPDANQTMRLTYGRVQDYYPADAVHYNYYTTLEGVMQKEDPGNWEFTVPGRLKELYNSKDYGVYGSDGEMIVNFISNTDITGGNSGSPVLDAQGNLIGLAFDGNWEAMSGNILFEPELQRTINVDIRYVLFIIDKYAGAKNLIAEMKIIQ
ncbi:MAG TPA: S46 family peptidase [Bacteroidales bacterium]|nr:S46 family peptidase [Bacteroidales bacterium]HQI71009.1 S46 family peptidase [Bacteroidales bacterium]